MSTNTDVSITIRENATCLTLCSGSTTTSCQRNNEVWEIDVVKNDTVTFYNQTSDQVQVTISNGTYVSADQFPLNAKSGSTVYSKKVTIEKDPPAHTPPQPAYCEITLASTGIGGPSQCGGPNVKPKMKVT